MKSYDEMAQSVLQRIQTEKPKRINPKRIGILVAVLTLLAALAVGTISVYGSTENILRRKFGVFGEYYFDETVASQTEFNGKTLYYCRSWDSIHYFYDKDYNEYRCDTDGNIRNVSMSGLENDTGPLDTYVNADTASDKKLQKIASRIAKKLCGDDYEDFELYYVFEDESGRDTGFIFGKVYNGWVLGDHCSVFLNLESMTYRFSRTDPDTYNRFEESMLDNVSQSEMDDYYAERVREDYGEKLLDYDIVRYEMFFYDNHYYINIIGNIHYQTTFTDTGKTEEQYDEVDYGHWFHKAVELTLEQKKDLARKYAVELYGEQALEKYNCIYEVGSYIYFSYIYNDIFNLASFNVLLNEDGSLSSISTPPSTQMAGLDFSVLDSITQEDLDTLAGAVMDRVYGKDREQQYEGSDSYVYEKDGQYFVTYGANVYTIIEDDMQLYSTYLSMRYPIGADFDITDPEAVEYAMANLEQMGMD